MRKKSKYYARSRRKRKSNSRYLYGILALGIFVFVVGMFFVGRGAKSKNFDAKRVRSNESVAFYPRHTEGVGKAFAEKLCDSGKKNTVYDYKTYKMNDYYCYDYGDNRTLFLDKNHKTPQLQNLGDRGKMIISDYLRYEMKANGRQEAYTSEFLEDTYYTNLKMEDFEYQFNKEAIICTFEKYNMSVEIPLKFIAKELGLDLGIPQEAYKKPIYIDPERPMVALTFDDGPSINSDYTDKILDELYKYDSSATFYVVGRSLSEKTVPVLRKGIELGNQYGSHSHSHANLVKLDDEQIYQEVMGVSDFFQKQLDYKITSYRPPYGSYNEKVDSVIPLPAILWNVDSSDWESKNSNTILSKVISGTTNKSVILLHDIHETSMKAVVDGKMIKMLIDQGYQLVTIDELAKSEGVELVQGVHFCWD